MGTGHQSTPSNGRTVAILKELVGVLRPWVFFLWLPALAFPGALYVHDVGWPLPWNLYGLCFAGIFSAMCTQHFFHVAGGSSSTIETVVPKRTLATLGLAAAAPLVGIVSLFVMARGWVVALLFVGASICLVGYAIPAVKTEWYWGIGNGIVSIGVYYVLTGAVTGGVMVGAAAMACFYYNMLHSARLAEGDYADAEGKAEKGYYIQRYAFFLGTTLFPISFLI